MPRRLYNEYIDTLAAKFLRRLHDIEAEYNFDYGDEFEFAICEILRSFLPTKYGICRGFVVAPDGRKHGDDIIVYDQERFPTLRLLGRETFLRKESIPIEAVYAYIEAKHTLNPESFARAIQQVVDVKQLCDQRAKVGLLQVDPYVPNDTPLPRPIDTLPSHRNPKEAFTVVQRIKSNHPDIYGIKPKAPLKVVPAPPPAPAEHEEPTSELRHVIVHTDRTCIGNPGPGGYGVILTLGAHQKEVSGGFRRTTNNRMELMAAIVALENLKYPCKVTLYSDSQYLVNSMSKGWALSWRAKGWMRTKREQAAHADLWKRLLDLTAQHEVEFVSVKGHADSPENIRCDFLSMRAAEAADLPADIEYENDEGAHTASPSLFAETANSSTIDAEPKLRRGWKEIAHTELDLAEVLHGSCARAFGDFIYVIRYCRIPVYIGMTRDTINNRMWHHIKEHSNVGVAMMADKSNDFVGWSVLVIQIEGEIEAAETYYIHRVRPPMNIEDNGNNQDNVTQTVRIFKRNYRPDPSFKYRRRKHCSGRR